MEDYSEILRTHVIKRVPGKLTPLPPAERQGYVGNLSNKTRTELLELLTRQNKILSNKAFISKLPDRGARLQETKKRIEEALAPNEDVDAACDLLSGLKIKDNPDVQGMEWKGALLDRTEKVACDLDSDDEEYVKDPLKALVNRDECKRIVRRRTNSDASLITPNDIEDALSMDSTKDEERTEILLERFSQVKAVERFKPNRSLHSGNSSPRSIGSGSDDTKPKSRSLWEESSACPPPLRNAETKPVSLQESMKLQKEQVEKLKEIQIVSAAERLRKPRDVCIGDTLPSTIDTTAYRDVPHGDECESEGEQSSDGEGCVVYPVDNE